MEVDLPVEAGAVNIPSLVEDQVEEVETSSTVAAPQRRRRGRKAVPMDTMTTLPTAELSSWSKDYVANMSNGWRTKMDHKAVSQAKKNAEFWVLGCGLGGIGTNTMRSGLPNPLEEFSGANLFYVLTGRDYRSGQKRSRDTASPDEGDTARQVRRRTRSVEPARGGPLNLHDNDYTVGLEEDDGPVGGFDDDVEFPRDAPEPLDDRSSLMPWNITASQRGSSVMRSRAGSIAGSISAVGGITGRTPKQHARLRSGSLLAGRAPSIASGGDQAASGSSAGDDIGITLGTDFDLFGPAGAGEQLQHPTLDVESDNFLGFIHNAMEEKETSEAEPDQVTFEELLPPESNSFTVAAQGFLHVLSLASKGLLLVSQKQDYGDISIKFVASA